MSRLRALVSPTVRIRTVIAVTAAVLSAVSGAAVARAQTPGGRDASVSRVDLSGPFVQFGGLVGSSSGESGPVAQSDNGFGWSFGGGIGLHRHVAAVGNYAILQVKPLSAQMYDLEQRELGLRLRFGGGESPALFFVEGGGALRRARRPSADVFGATPPPGAGSTVRVSGMAAWFGPGIQYFVGRRLGAEVTAAWAWGDLDTAHLQGSNVELERPIGIITLRLRAAIVVALF